MKNTDKATMGIDKLILRQLRLSRSWSQEKLADRANVNLRTVQRIETEGRASLRSLEALATALETTQAELLLTPKSSIILNPLKTAEPVLCLTTCALIVLSLTFQAITVLNGLNSPPVVFISYFPLCLASFTILGTLFPLKKYKLPVCLCLFFIVAAFAPEPIYSKAVMLIICIGVFEFCTRTGDYLRKRFFLHICP